MALSETTGIGGTGVNAGEAITQAPGTNNTEIATTAFVQAAASIPAGSTSSQILIGGSPLSWTSTLPAAVQGNITAVGTVTSGTWAGSNVAVNHGGTGLATLTAHAVILGEGTSNVSFATIGTGGNILIDQGAGADPAFTAVSGDITLSSAGVASVVAIKGASLGTITATSGNLLIGSGTQWVTQAVTGDVAITSGGVTSVNSLHSGAFANPTGTVGLSATNGSATTAMRSDGAPALSQAIVPTWTGTHTFTAGTAAILVQPTNGTNGYGIEEVYTAGGSVAGGAVLNLITIADSVNLTGTIGFVFGLEVNQVFGGSSQNGGRVAVTGIVNNTAATSASNSNRNYVGVQGAAVVGSGDTGAIGAQAGTVFGGNFLTKNPGQNPGFTYLLSENAVEFDIYNVSLSVSTAGAKYSLGGAYVSFRRTRGSSVDTAIDIGGGGSSGPSPYNTADVGWGYGICFTDIHGGAPVNSDSVLFGSSFVTVGNVTVSTGINLSGFRFSGNAFQATGFSINNSGAATTAQIYGGTTNSSTAILSSTSGSASTDAIALRATSTVVQNLAGSGTNCATFTGGAGLQLGAPTGADKGLGTLNVASNIYLNNTSYTNPDFVLEHAYTGKIEKYAKNIGASEYKGLMPLSELREFTKTNFRLPGTNDEPAGVVERFDFLLAKVEELVLYVLDINERLEKLRLWKEGITL
jgi:hypothetical protein